MDNSNNPGPRAPRAGERTKCFSLHRARFRFFWNEKRMAAWIMLLGARALLKRALAIVTLRPAQRRSGTEGLRMVSVLSMPRTGSTLAKRYLGAFEAVRIAPLQSFEESLKQAAGTESAQILLDKKTDNIKRLHQIVPLVGRDVAFLCLVRDPRDELVSLTETDRHRPVPRDARFWPYWTHRYSRAFKVLRRLAALGAPVALVRYEDLASYPVAVKKSFLEWLGLDAAEVDEGYEAVAGDEDVSKHEDWKTHEQSRVHSSSVGRWKIAEGETAAAVSAFSRYRPAVRLMSRLGYAADASAGEVSPLRERWFRGITILSHTHTAEPSSR